MKILMFSGGLDSTYLAWKLLKDKTEGVHIHYVSIRNDCEDIWKKEDVATEKIISYFRVHNFQFKYSKSKFEFFGHPQSGFDSDLLMVVAQKLALNSYGDKIDILLGWNPYDMTREVIIDRSNRHVTQNIWKALVESLENRQYINKELQFPLIEWGTTKDIILKEMPQELIDLTWSCRKANDVPCGKCHSCIERNPISNKKMVMKCSIYEKRPEICRSFPLRKEHLDTKKYCSYTFNENGERIGECNLCGECCMVLHVDLHNQGDSFIPGYPCPYLIQS